MIEYGTANKKHLREILELYKQLKTDEEPINIDDANKIWEKIKQSNIKYFIAKENDRIIASCYICIIPNLTKKGKFIGFIENVITDNKYRRKGIGRTIMENAIGFAKENNCYKVLLQSGNQRMEAHEFYEALGFIKVSKSSFEKIF